MTASRGGAIDIVLFDIGGVVVEVNDFTRLLHGLGIDDVDAFHERWLMCPAVRTFESGGSDVPTFAASTVEDLDLDMTPDAFLDAFHRWPKGVFPGILELIQETGLLKPDAEIYAHVAEALESHPERILFLDDNQINVDAARHAGFRSERVRSVDESRAALVHHQVL